MKNEKLAIMEKFLFHSVSFGQTFLFQLFLFVNFFFLKEKVGRKVWVVTLSWFLCLTSFNFSYSEEGPKINTILPMTSIAVSDDALSTHFNPAGLGIGQGFNGYYLRTYRGEYEGDDAIFLSGWNYGFGAEFATTSDGIDFRHYTLSDGSRLGSIYIGTGYSWFTSENKDYDRLSFWQIGVRHHRRYLSIGAVGRNLKLPDFLFWKEEPRPELFGKELPRVYDLGIAFRPGTDRLTFSVDARHQSGVKGFDFNYAIELQPVCGLLLRGSLNEDKNFNLLFGVNLGQIGLGTYNTFDKQRHHQDGVGYLYFSQATHATSYIRRKRIVEADLSEIENVLQRAKTDESVVGVILNLRGTNYGIGRLQEIREVVLDFKKTGKKVLCYTSSCGTGNYLVASACDKIALHPSGEIRLIGIRAESTFYKGALDKLGVRADVEHIGEYKSASESVTRETMSPAHREATDSLLDELFEQLTLAIAEGRRFAVTELKQKIDYGPYTATEALDAGLIDELAYDDEIEEISPKLMGKKYPLLKAAEYQRMQRYEPEWRTPLPKIALIHAEGMIVSGESFSNPLTGDKMMGGKTITEALKTARLDSSVKAIVLRIDSPGGFIQPSDSIWREVVLAQKQKPIIVSMSDVAASGGYYIAAPADVIVAEPGTITGSIGVISGKYSLKGLYDKIGIKKEILKRGKYADFYTDYGDYPEAEQAIITRQIKLMYDDFVHKVAQGRNMTDVEVDQIGRGRVWTGSQAKANGLVDRIGGLDLALEIAKERAGLPKETEVQIIQLPKSDIFSRVLGLKLMKARFPFSDFQTSIKAKRILELFTQDKIFMLMPYQVKIY
ncbi:signal peptide peptidase SppA [Candidatus Poribacteria bacterium]|nr:signal peptide peptidase SppA [Candidatus Poribacteria bacterium]